MSSTEQFGAHSHTATQDAHRRLVRLLVKQGLLKSETNVDGFQVADAAPIRHFAEGGAFDEKAALHTVAQALKIDCIWIDRELANNLHHLCEESPFSKVSRDEWLSFLAAPLAYTEGQTPQVVFANPLDREAVQRLEFILEQRMAVVIGNESGIRAVHSLPTAQQAQEGINLIVSAALPAPSSTSAQVSLSLSPVTTDDPCAAPVVRLVNRLFLESVGRDASDIHLSPQQERLLVRIRVDGVVRSLFEIPQELKNPVISRIKLLSGMDIAERRLPQDGRFQVKTASGVRDLRVSTVPSHFGESVVIRVLHNTLQRMSLEGIGIPEPAYSTLRQLLNSTSKVLLVTGPTGSGKTSTLYSCLRELHDGTRNIITLEDPIEYRLAGITQIQVNPKQGFTFAEGLRSVLRQDPDVIMVGEIRDQETCETAFHAAQTGHLVLSTLHTNSAEDTVVRLLDLQLPHFVLAASLGGVIAQRLVRTLCTHCRQPIADQDTERVAALGLDPHMVYRENGCSACGQTGFHGRTGVFSVLAVDDTVRDALRQGLSGLALDEVLAAQGYRTLSGAVLPLLAAGTTSLAEAERVLGPIGMVANRGSKAAFPEIPQDGRSPRRPRVLLVEDDHSTREVLRLLFEDELYEVVEAGNGRDALEALYSTPCDIVVADVRMPILDGTGLLQRIRLDPHTRNLPVMMLTANASEEAELSLLSGGADDYVSKTAQKDILLARMRRLLAARSAA